VPLLRADGLSRLSFSYGDAPLSERRDRSNRSSGQASANVGPLAPPALGEAQPSEPLPDFHLRPSFGGSFSPRGSAGSDGRPAESPSVAEQARGSVQVQYPPFITQSSRRSSEGSRLRVSDSNIDLPLRPSSPGSSPRQSRHLLSPYPYHHHAAAHSSLRASNDSSHEFSNISPRTSELMNLSPYASHSPYPAHTISPAMRPLAPNPDHHRTSANELPEPVRFSRDMSVPVPGPELRESLARDVRKYVRQLTAGCGRPTCQNTFCATAAATKRSTAKTAAALAEAASPPRRPSKGPSPAGAAGAGAGSSVRPHGATSMLPLPPAIATVFALQLATSR
jgi:hypothetical protein